MGTKTNESPSCCGGESVTASISTGQMPSDEAIREQVRAGYAAVAQRDGGACCGEASVSARTFAEGLGYSAEELDVIPDEANLGLSCGNPTAMASLKPGEVVVDLGSGAGMDAFLAAARVGEEGRVIGVDMTPEMLARARETAVKRGVASTVEFREGLIEELPVVSNSVDVVISNCVINLSPEKGRVFREAFRVLKSGGRLAVSDVCLSRPLPETIQGAMAAYVACISGALVAEDYMGLMTEAGFTDVQWTRTNADVLVESACHDPMLQEGIKALGDETLESIKGSVWSYKIEARKP